MIRRFTSGPKPASRVSDMTSSSGVGAVVAHAQAVAHGVEAGEVRRALARRDQVVRGQRVLEVRAADLDDLGARARARCRRPASNGGEHAGLVALAAELAHDADAHAAQVAARRLRGPPRRPAATGRGIDVESHGSCPAITSCSSAASSTVRPNGPAWSSEDENAISP